MVLMPQTNTVGVSQKLHPEERSRLRKVVEAIKPPDVGVIVRTAARDREEEDLKRDLDFLIRKWKEIKNAAQLIPAPSLLYSEPELEIRVTRDLLNDEWERVITDSPAAHKRLRDYLKAVAPWLVEKVVLYQGKEPLFKSLDINRQIKEALRHEVALPSGGSIVIDPTEALISIDVNTGRYVGRSNLEDTVLRTNVEAAREIVRQLRLRDIRGHHRHRFHRHDRVEEPQGGSGSTRERTREGPHQDLRGGTVEAGAGGDDAQERLGRVDRSLRRNLPHVPGPRGHLPRTLTLSLGSSLYGGSVAILKVPRASLLATTSVTVIASAAWRSIH